jgi:hypothetical protein
VTVEDLKDPSFSVAELSDEDFVIYQVASKALESGDPHFAGQIVQREADRDPTVHLPLFFSRAWPQPEVTFELWNEVLSERGLS